MLVIIWEQEHWPPSLKIHSPWLGAWHLRILVAQCNSWVYLCNISYKSLCALIWLQPQYCAAEERKHMIFQDDCCRLLQPPYLKTISSRFSERLPKGTCRQMIEQDNHHTHACRQACTGTHTWTDYTHSHLQTYPYIWIKIKVTYIY